MSFSARLVDVEIFHSISNIKCDWWYWIKVSGSPAFIWYHWINPAINPGRCRLMTVFIQFFLLVLSYCRIISLNIFISCIGRKSSETQNSSRFILSFIVL